MATLRFKKDEICTLGQLQNQGTGLAKSVIPKPRRGSQSDLVDLLDGEIST